MKVNFCLTLNPQKVTNKNCQALCKILLHNA